MLITFMEAMAGINRKDWMGDRAEHMGERVHGLKSVVLTNVPENARLEGEYRQGAMGLSEEAESSSTRRVSSKEKAHKARQAVVRSDASLSKWSAPLQHIG